MRLLRRLAPAQRELAIRLRLMRSALSPRTRRAERRADVLLVSYPKCGRTWLTMMLSHALARLAGLDDVDYLTTDLLDGRAERLPRIRVSHDDNPHWKSARALSRSKQRYRDQGVVLLVRDPRDVVVSMYFERTRRERAYAGTLAEFLHERRGSLDTILAYYGIWAEQGPRLPHFLLVRYEELRADPGAGLERILAFAGVADVTVAEIEAAVAFASFENMRAMEQGQVFASGRLRPRDPADVESYKTRRGKVGGYVDYLQPDEIAWMEQRIRSTLDPAFGYGSPAHASLEPPASLRTAP
ncbi:MAG TPA: sulfotransferase domain-containing protein [Planctomycetota bacterium]